MSERPAHGRALFYTRDSGGEHENTPGEYVRWAQRTASEYEARFAGTPDQIERMIRAGTPADGDVFIDFGVKGNQLSRRGLDELIKTVQADPSVTHVFIPRRDRLARPDDPVDALAIEASLRRPGVTLVFMDRVLPPLGRGRRDIAETILGLIDYDKAGQDRLELARKILYAQLKLARGGFSTGGRPPYGFCRWLVKEDGTAVRQLQDGEWVKMAGHRVVWMPDPDERVWATIRRILDLLETKPASRVAAQLTAEGIPPPDFGRERTDRGVRHTTSGVWHQVTVANIARNPLLRAVVSYGRRSMGDQLRFDPGQPRELTDSDLRADGKPKVTVNDEAVRITAPVRFAPPVEPDRVERVVQALNRRSGTQRGKPRSQDPSQNPLGCRVFDMACAWPMYRRPYQSAFRYVCGLYQQSHGAKCDHNTVDGVRATQFVLSCVKQRVLAPGFRDRLRAKLEAIARREQGKTDAGQGPLDSLRRSLEEVRRKRALAEQNLALANGPEQFQAVSRVFDQLRREEAALVEQLQSAQQGADSSIDWPAEVDAAMRAFDRLGELASRPANLAGIADLFGRLNARLFLRFTEADWGKRKVRKVSGGVVTFGTAPSPVPLYEGPTGRRALGGQSGPPVANSWGEGNAQKPTGSGREGGSLGNVSRADRI